VAGKKKKEIVVSPPYPPRRTEELLEDTTTAERVRVFEISARIGKYLRWLLIAVGALLAFVSISALSFLDVRLVFTPGWRTVSLVVFGFVGAVNVFCGLVMLAKE
jgi:hypothetical protein